MTGTVMLPATTLTVMLVGDVVGFCGAGGAAEVFRVKLIEVPTAPDDGVTVKAPLPTPGEVTVVVNVPEPDVVLVPVSPHSKVCVVGDTVKGVVGVGGGGASPAGPATPITCDVSITRFWASVTMSWLVPQPFCVTRKLPPLVVTIDGKTLKNCGNGATTT